MQTQLSTSSVAEHSSQYYHTIYPIPYHYGSLDGSKGRWKFLLDTVLAVMALTMLWPLLLGISIAVKLDSYGPVLYRQRVLGKNGRIFYAYAFRTQHINSRQKTRIGRFLCQTGLTDLPLLINVLKHEMSFVGPRMIAPEQIVTFGSYADRLLTRTPGITGFWQINGCQPEKRIEQDLYYIENSSIKYDLVLLWRTFLVISHSRRKAK